MRARRVEVHPKVAGQPLPTLLQTVMPRLQKDKQLKSDAIQNAENAIADMVSKGEAFAGRFINMSLLIASLTVLFATCLCSM